MADFVESLKTYAALITVYRATYYTQSILRHLYTIPRTLPTLVLEK